MAKPERTADIEARIIALEESAMHMDHLLKKLNDVVCSLQDRLDDQTRLVTQLSQAVKRIPGAEEEQRSLEDERPPHY